MANSLNGKKVAILATDGFEQSELIEPRHALQQAGAITQVVSPKGGKINVVNAVRQATRSGPWARTILERDKAIEKIDPKLVLRRDQKEAKVVILIATKFS